MKSPRMPHTSLTKTLTTLCVFGTALSAALLGSHPAQGATLTWTGASGTSWNGANWLGGATTFNAGDIGVFGATASAPTNQIGVGYGSATAPLGGIDIRNDGSYAVTFTGGVIFMGSGGLTSTRSTAGSVTFGNNIRFTTDQVWNIGSGANVTMSAALYNSGNATVGTNNNFEKIGSGTLTLVGTGGDVGGAGKTFKITDGVVSIAGNGALGSTSSTLDLNGGTLQTTASLTQARAVTLSANSTIRPTSGTLTISGTISGAGGLAKAGDGTLTLSAANTYTGTTTISAGQLSMGNGSALGTGTITFGGGTLQYGSGITTDLSGRIAASGSAIAVDTGANAVAWATGLASTNTGGLTKLGSGTLTLSGSNGYTGTTTISAGQLSLSGGDNRLAATAPLTITGGVLDLGSRGQTTSGAISFQGGTVQSGTLTSTGAAFDGQAGTVSAVLAGSVGLTKTTSGTLTLSAANTYTGTTTLSAGVLSVGANSGLGDTTSRLVFSGGTLEVTGTTMTSLGSRPVSFTSGADVGIRITGTNNFALSNNLTQGTGGLTFAGSSSVSQLTLSGSNSGFTGTITVMSGKLNFGNLSNGGANSVSASNALVMNGSSVVSLGNVFTNGNANIGPLSSSSPNAVINTFNGLGAGIRTLVVNQDIDTTFAGALQQDNSANSRFLGLTKAGVGTLALTGSNIHSGGSTVVAGTLRVGNANALGVSTGPLAVNGGTLDLGGFSVAVGALSGSAGGVITTNAVAGTATLTTAVDSGTSIFRGVIQDNGPGVVALTKSGAGVLALTGANTFTGATTISAGGIGIVDVNALQNTSGVNIADGAAFGWGGGAATFARNITVTSGMGTVGNVGSGPLTLSGQLTNNGTSLVLNSGTFVVSGQVTGAGSGGFVVNAARVTLTNAANNYIGPTTISAGVLEMGPTGSINSSSGVTLNGATAELKYNSATPLASPLTFTQGTISGTGAIGTLVSVAAGDILSPGNSPGTQAYTAGLEWAPSGRYDWELNALTGAAGTNWDQLAVTGILDLDGLSALNPFNLNLISLTGGNVPGPLDSPYVAGSSYQFTIATFDTLTVPMGFSTAAGSDLTSLFAINLNNWQGTKPAAADISVKVSAGGTGIDLVVVPEPAALALASIGIAAAAWARRRSLTK